MQTIFHIVAHSFFSLHNVDQHVGTIFVWPIPIFLSVSIIECIQTFSLAFQSIVFDSIKLSIANEGLCTHACHSSDPFSNTAEETTSRAGRKMCIKNDIFIEFLLVRNQHLLRPSIIIIIVVIAIAVAVAAVVVDDDDEIKLLSIQKYRFWSNGFKAYTFQLGFFSFLLFRYRMNKRKKWKWNNERNRSDPVVHGHCRPRPVCRTDLLLLYIHTLFKMYTIKSIGHFRNVRSPVLYQIDSNQLSLNVPQAQIHIDSRFIQLNYGLKWWKDH